ncbi:MAG: protein translocase subunit SecF [archaeon]
MSILEFKITEKSLNKSLAIPIALLLIAIIGMGFTYATEGELLKKGIDLEGGMQITIHHSTPVDTAELEAGLRAALGVTDVSAVTTTDPATRVQETIVISISGETNTESAISAIENQLNIQLSPNSYSIMVLGPSLARSFWAQAQWALSFAFLFMAIVIGLYYRKLVPALAIIIATIYDLIIIVGFMSFFHIPLTLATVAALLMIIGYGVDTNVLLTNKVIKEKAGSLYERLNAGFRTGLMMSATTISVLLALLIVGGAYSLVLRQMAIILLIGLIADIPNTWILNAKILTWHQKQ